MYIYPQCTYVHTHTRAVTTKFEAVRLNEVAIGSTREPQWLQYFKLVFLKIQNVPLRMVFANLVTYVDNVCRNHHN